MVLNYQNRIGEIDIIAMDGECIVFVEVKYRKSSKYGFPIEAAVNYQKQKNIIMVANYFIMNE
ncbi:YraN family protein [Lachnobacterium bovis]|uniref:YraN family protein n=1 Tax=Lachnobacterium bovis TaxID=140626 RepID=UPI00241827FB